MSPSFSPPIPHFMSDARSISSRFPLRRKSGAHRLEIGPLLLIYLFSEGTYVSIYDVSPLDGSPSAISIDSTVERSQLLFMALPAENMSSPDLTRKGTSDDMAVSPAGATAHDHDTPNFKRTLFKSSKVVAAAEWYDGLYYRQELHAID